MPLLKTNLRYTIELLRAHPDHIFTFGDNLERKGRGGQAIIRYEPNAFGIATKRYPGTASHDYFDDIDCGDAVGMLRDVEQALILSQHHDFVLPFSTRLELGTGLAELPERAPFLYSTLQHYLIPEKEFIPNDPR